MKLSRRDFVQATSIGLTALLVPEFLWATTTEPKVKIVNYLSPKHLTRANRLSTDFIILHTTEGSFTGSLEELTHGGKANYLISENGTVCRIMKPDQISVGAGRSMWDGVTNLDNRAINVEFVGYHNKPLTEKQIKSGRQLIKVLQEIYGIRDDKVLPHSMVAYGRPSQFVSRSHRGRKRCGMFFSKDEIRDEFLLERMSLYDPDVASNRLVVADPSLERILYGNSPAFVRSLIEPVKKEIETKHSAIRTIKKEDDLIKIAGDEYADETTTYIFKNGLVQNGLELKGQGFNFYSIEKGTRIAPGYTYAGHTTEHGGTYKVVGENWNLPSTIYKWPNESIISGEDIRRDVMPKGTLILFRR